MPKRTASSSLNLVDIAEKAGVSRSTVSRVVNNEANVSPTTRDRVLAVINEVGYTPNAVARMLRTQRTRIIGVVISDPVHDLFASDNPYYYATLIQGIASVSQHRDYAMLLWAENPSEQDGRFYTRIVNHGLMDGLICVASRSTEENLVRRLVSNHTPTVLIGRPMGEFADQVSFVTIDNAEASEQAVMHLYEQGRRRIGHLTGDMSDSDSQERLLGYRQATQALGLYDESLIIEGRFNREAGYQNMQRLLKHKVDAVYAASDLIAIGAIQAIHEAGLQVPDDIALVGFDDFPLARQAQPPLTTVRQPLADKAKAATGLLLNLIEGKVSDPQEILLPTQLIIRESSGAPPDERTE